MQLNVITPLLALGLFILAGCEAPTAPVEDIPALQSVVAQDVSAVKGGESTEMNKLLAQIRAETARFHRVEAAVEAGYVSTEECVSNPAGPGAMGVHFVNFSLFGDGDFDPLQPEVLVYEPQKNGRMRLVAVEYLVFANPEDPGTAPDLLGVPFNGPMAHGDLPLHFELHVWLWKHNPDGLFAEWNAKVTCPPADHVE